MKGTVRYGRITLALAGLLTLCRAAPSAQVTVVLPDTSQTTTASVTISEQARVAVPAVVSFNVTNIGAATSANPAAVTIDRILLTTATKELRVSLRAAAASFTPPAAGATTWSAADVSWNAATWTAATAVVGTLSSAAFTTVATCNAGAAGCSVSGLVFSLASKPAVRRSGSHTLIVTWKVESIGL